MSGEACDLVYRDRESVCEPINASVASFTNLSRVKDDLGMLKTEKLSA